MLSAKVNQFSLSETGEILWQEKLNSPIPGLPVARLEKGAFSLKPVITIIDNEQTKKVEQTALKNHLTIWLNGHMKEVLEPLVLLEVPQGAAIKDDPVSQISARIYANMGIMPREELEDVIAELTPELRSDLRAKKIRLGPILAFIPALNKPAAVRLRGLLWTLFEGKSLPAKFPADGIVSKDLEEENPDKDFYRAIGYPVYGGRAVRIDMLDRVISCVYDHAEKGKFQARHEMAEWLGCSIEGLYKVLEGMGHTKIYDPADNVEEKPEIAEDAAKGKPQKEEPKEDVKEAVEGEKLETPKPKDPPKPELATFRLKKGKAFEKSSGGQKTFKKADKPKSGGKKDFKKKNDRPKKDRGARVITAEAKVSAEDSPFAILQQLKK